MKALETLINMKFDMLFQTWEETQAVNNNQKMLSSHWDVREKCFTRFR